MEQYVSYAISFLSLVGAILAWIAKIRWSNEFALAKDETIKSKEAQITVLEAQIKILQDFSPMKIQEYFFAVKKQLEEYNDLLQNKLKNAEETIKQVKRELDRKLEDLQVAQEEKERLKADLARVNEMYDSVKETIEEGAKRKEFLNMLNKIIETSYEKEGFKGLAEYMEKNQEVLERILENNKKLSEGLSNVTFKILEPEFSKIRLAAKDYSEIMEIKPKDEEQSNSV